MHGVVETLVHDNHNCQGRRRKAYHNIKAVWISYDSIS